MEYKFRWWHIGILLIIIFAYYKYTMSAYPSDNLTWIISKCVPGGTVYRTSAPDSSNAEWCIITPPNTFTGDSSCSVDTTPAHYTQCGSCSSTTNGVLLSGDTCHSTSCTPVWGCTTWSACSGGIQTRTCTDSNNCGVTTGKPATSQSCTSFTCTDSDGGLAYGVLGSTTGYMKPQSTTVSTYTDSCVDSKQLTEYSCSSAQVAIPSLYTCPGTCSNGICTTGTCITRDVLGGYINQWIAGTITRDSLGGYIMQWVNC